MDFLDGVLLRCDRSLYATWIVGLFGELKSLFLQSQDFERHCFFSDETSIFNSFRDMCCKKKRCEPENCLEWR